MSSLPIPNADAQAHSQQLALLIQDRISQYGGWLSFADFMQMVLYTPSLGYYSGGAKKFGVGGDFVTAPEISPLFAQAVANQVAQVLVETQGDVLELGAGSGKLAVDLLLSLQALNQLPSHYYILEVSAYLRQVQLETMQKSLPEALFERVVWLDTLPADFVGVMLGNEVLDAVPVNLVYKPAPADSQVLYERGVSFNGNFYWQDQPLTSGEIFDLANANELPDDYLTEISPAAIGLISSLGSSLKHGAIMMVDYGFSAREYYHPQRNLGTLMCHYQHYAHVDPLIYVGLQDITAHVDFTSVADAGEHSGLELMGFCSQAQFLMNCGILEIMSQVSPQDMARYAPLAAAAQKLLSPAEMGDLFKVIALGKGLNQALIGFSSGDKSHTL
ncbi:class I SAM-dependent methyltransferase [Methylotenera sp.]|uniref:class I SAM-dependent methyltransferase n=1 Tax=Methylotenera sp. TaxID=2051956 RepID=UPI002735AA20|nr:SAM-dependent methyltransferase [Methylotenera sp.]MDP3777341.1 SAM-dependent methyltransferase [Methylotenera sp.]